MRVSLYIIFDTGLVAPMSKHLQVHVYKIRNVQCALFYIILHSEEDCNRGRKPLLEKSSRL